MRGGAAAPPDARLEGRRVLVVEDEFLIAEQIVEALEAAGAVPVGPAPSVAAAMRLAERETLDAAVLDMNLQGKPVWPVAAAMRARGVPYIFATGYGEIAPPPDEALRAHFIQKPFERADLLAALAALA